MGIEKRRNFSLCIVANEACNCMAFNAYHIILRVFNFTNFAF